MLSVGLLINKKKKPGHNTIHFHDIIFSCHEVDKYKAINHSIVRIFQIEPWKIQIEAALI